MKKEEITIYRGTSQERKPCAVRDVKAPLSDRETPPSALKAFYKQNRLTADELRARLERLNTIFPELPFSSQEREAFRDLEKMLARDEEGKR